MSPFHFRRKQWTFQLGLQRGFRKVVCLEITPLPILSLSKCQFLELTKPHLGLVSEHHSLTTQELCPLGNDKERQHSCFHRALFSESLNIRIEYVFENHHLVLCFHNCFFLFLLFLSFFFVSELLFHTHSSYNFNMSTR